MERQGTAKVPTSGSEAGGVSGPTHRPPSPWLVLPGGGGDSRKNPRVPGAPFSAPPAPTCPEVPAALKDCSFLWDFSSGHLYPLTPRCISLSFLAQPFSLSLGGSPRKAVPHFCPVPCTCLELVHPSCPALHLPLPLNSLPCRLGVTAVSL